MVGGLEERSRAPHRIPHKTSKAEEEAIVQARKKAPCYGPRRLKREFGLKAGKNAIGRILKERELARRKRKKREKQRDLREVKAQYRALTHLQMDVKYLNDIPFYWAQMELLGLPRFEYTIRDTKSGALFLGFGHQLSVTYASLLIRRCLVHLGRCGIEPSSVTVQTDRGSEFSGGQKRKRDFGFVHTVEKLCGARQVFTPPRWPKANADVEAVHRLVEEEFFDLEGFAGLRRLDLDRLHADARSSRPARVQPACRMDRGRCAQRLEPHPSRRRRTSTHSTILLSRSIPHCEAQPTATMFGGQA